MKKNMGIADRAIRLLIAVGVGALYYFKVIDGMLAYILLAVAIIFLLTSLVSVCPLYRLLGIRTCKLN